MIWPVIEKPDAGVSARTGVKPNMIDYEASRATFTWESLAMLLTGCLEVAVSTSRTKPWIATPQARAATMRRFDS